MWVTPIQQIVIEIAIECTLIVIFVHAIRVDVIINIAVVVSAAVVIVIIVVISFCVDLIAVFRS